MWYNSLMKTTRESIIKVLEEIKPRFEKRGIEEIALFGSFSNSSQNVYSDIDIAIKKRSDFLDKHSAYDYFETLNELRETLRQKLHRPVDIFDLDSDSPLKRRIESELIYV